jgi:hypothetical protein
MRLLAMGLLVAAAGCASTGEGGPRPSRNEITLAEIEGTPGARTAQDVINRLRPQWLRGRGSGTFNKTAEEGIIVYVDGLRSGYLPVTQLVARAQSAGTNPLEGITADRVSRILYYTASDATQKYGTGHAFGAIEVITRR